MPLAQQIAQGLTQGVIDGLAQNRAVLAELAGDLARSAISAWRAMEATAEDAQQPAEINQVNDAIQSAINAGDVPPP